MEKKAFDLFDMYKKLYSEQRHEEETKYIYTKMMTNVIAPKQGNPHMARHALRFKLDLL